MGTLLVEPEDYVWEVPWRWYWQKDDGKFEAYNDQFNACIEVAFGSQHAQGRFTTPPIVRYIDDTPQPHHIDFTKNTQTNARTGFVRGITRRKTQVL